MLEKYTLRNGIPAFIVPWRASPVVSVQIWVRRGSIDEAESVAGISHFLEHALFKGTKRRGVGEVAGEIENRGGEINAFTSLEETCYYVTIASRYFDTGLDVLADAIRDPLFDPMEMEREREVILEEIRRAEDSPFKMVSTHLWSEMFRDTPYGRPVLGYENTVRKITPQKLREYHRAHYHAGTMGIVIVGDIDPAKTVASLQRQLGRIPDRGGKRRGIVVKNRTRPSYFAIARDITECQIQIGYSGPSVAEPYTPALDVACSAIGQGESSRLYQRLVKEKKVALDCHFGLASTAHCGLVSLSLVCIPERTTEAVTEARLLFDEIATDGIRLREIDRVKSSVEAEIVVAKETVEGYARRLGYYYSQFGDPLYEKRYVEAALSTEPDAAHRAFTECLMAPPVVSLARPNAAAVSEKEIMKALRPTRARRRPLPPPAPVLERTTISNVTCLLKKVDSLPVIALKLVFKGGVRAEAGRPAGLAHLFQRVWTSGTPSFTALQIADQLERLGASLHGFAGRNTMGVSCEFLAKQWPVIKPMLSEVILAPTFPTNELETERDLILRDIAAETDSPGALCQSNFLEALYGSHPYGRSPIGTTESVSSMDQNTLKDFYRDSITRRDAVLSVVGAVESEGWLAEVGSILAKLPATGPGLRPFPVPVGPTDLDVRIALKQPLQQSHVLVGFLGPDCNSPHRYALKLLSSALAGQGGRLFLELRDKQSLAYTVSPLSSDGPEPGVFGFYIGCAPDKVPRAIAGIRAELNRILDKALSSTELERAKRYWIGRFELDMQRYSAQALTFALDESYGLGFRHALEVSDRIRAVRSEDVLQAARTYLSPERAVLSVVHPAPLDEAVVRNAWKTTISGPARKLPASEFHHP